MSLRRFRAERLLREEFEARRGRVTAIVRARLGASGADLDASDLDACYAQAFHGLYAAVVDGQQIENPSGWLVLVTYRRAIEESRARRHLANAEPDGAEDRDLAAELDDRIRLRQLFEALRGGLSQRELQAAALCYLQGLSRVEAAARIGVSEARMRKLMEGPGAGRPGVAGKVGALVATIRDGGWCEEQGSLMRGLAYGILDPDGERHRLAMMHSSECPACRAYVVSLRGLAAVLPPVPALFHWALGGAIGVAGGSCGPGIAAGGHAGGGVGGCSSGAGSGTAGALTPAAAPALGAGASASGAAGAAGAGAAGGGWLLAGGTVGTKLAVGCLLVLGVGAGCVALSEHPAGVGALRHGHATARAAPARGGTLLESPAGESPAAGRVIAGGLGRGVASATASSPAGAPPSPSSRASREFGLELALGAARSPATSGQAPSARAAFVTHPAQASESSAGGASGEAGSPVQDAGARLTGARSGPAPAAQREFAPG
jgi:RNA polymerase sigma factor (sigma-70 family)